jgi:hypothetical protein
MLLLPIILLLSELGCMHECCAGMDVIQPRPVPFQHSLQLLPRPCFLDV